ncbi:MAG: hypothetical protein ACYCQI_16290 [Gammaproteobacteria bacterium]
MDRYTITFYDETSEKIKERAQKKGISSIAQCIRELVELALKFEEMTEKSEGSLQENDLVTLLSEIKNLLKNNLNWSLETRFLSRFLIENNPNVTKEKQTEVLQKFKERAQDLVNGMLQEVTD